jgi:phosphoglycerate dehydrogenase-like enzyme
MIQLMVLDDEADALRAALAPRLPADITARYYRHGADVDRDGLAAEVAFGQPDALAAVLPRMRYLRWLQSTWAGVTSLIEAGREDYCLTGVKGIFGALMSEYVLGWLLAQERGVIRHAQATHWQRPPERSLADLRLGIAGVGSIGAEVATRCAPFFREVRGLNRSGAPVAACDRCYAVSDRLAFAADLDALVLLLPDTPATRGTRRCAAAGGAATRCDADQRRACGGTRPGRSAGVPRIRGAGGAGAGRAGQGAAARRRPAMAHAGRLYHLAFRGADGERGDRGAVS